MADDKSADVETVPISEEVSKTEEKTIVPKRKSSSVLDPMPVVSGPRQRKKAADLYQVEVKDKPEFVIKPGKGTKLGDIPNVHYLLNKYKADDELISGLHSALYRRPGVAHRRKRNIFEFSGLAYEEGEREKELERVQERLSKWTIALLNSALDSFELPRGAGDEGKKEAKVDRLVQFLDEPKKLSDKDLAEQAAKKRDAAKAKREKNKTPKSAAKEGRKSETGKESARKRKKDVSEEEAEPSEGFDEVEVDEEQPKKRTKKENGTAEKKPPSANKTSGRKRKSGVDQDASAEQPIKGSGSEEGLPSDVEIKEATLALLEVSDVNKVTVKDILEVLKEKFGKDLKSKKPLVKQVAVDYAKSQAAADAADDNNEAAEEGGEMADALDSAVKQQADDAEAPEEEQANEPQTAEAMEAEVAKDLVVKDLEAKEPETNNEALKSEIKASESEPEDAKEMEEAKETEEAGDAMQTEELKGEAVAAAPAEGAEEGKAAEADDKTVDA